MFKYPDHCESERAFKNFTGRTERNGTSTTAIVSQFAEADDSAVVYLTRRMIMTLHLALQPLLSILAGILILIRPKLLNYVVAIYLIIVGVLGIFPQLR